MNIYHKRRQELLQSIPKNSIAILKNAGSKYRNFDSDYPHRPDSSFYYYSGFTEADSILVLTNLGGENKSHLFCAEKDPFHEKWEGKRMGPEAAKTQLELTSATALKEFWNQLPGHMSSHQNILIDWKSDDIFFQKVLKTLDKMGEFRRTKKSKPTTITQLLPFMQRQRLIKSNEEIVLMKKAAQISSRAHKVAMGFARAGRFEYQVQGAMEYIFKNSGALSSAYNSIVASGDNANTLHYVENNKILNDGDLLLIDAGCEFQYYASDITRTFPINGKFSGAQKEIYEVVLKAQKGAFNIIKIGTKPSEIHKAACQEIIKGLLDLKFLSGSVEEHLDKTPSEFKEYYPHGTGHWLGLDVHDDNTYFLEDGSEMSLVAGSVFTVEPGIYLDQFRLNIPEKYRGIGIRIEDDIHITPNGYENLSIDAPKEILEVEAACSINYNDLI